jgi:predicted thioesterase
MSGGIVSGLTATVEQVVTAADTAASLGSGDLEVLGTPRLLALAEQATCAAVAAALPAGTTSVGTRVRLDHLKASPVGSPVRVTATVTRVDGRLIGFEVVAEHGDGTLVGHGEVTRVVVDRERFLARLGSAAG